MNLEFPCYGPDKDTLVLGQAESYFQTNYTGAFPYENESPISTCPEYRWRMDSLDLPDIRYGVIGAIDLNQL